MIIHHTLKSSNDFGRVSGEVIEDYPDDQPYPSCLVFGRTQSGGPLHVVRWIDFHLFWQQCWQVSCGSAR